MKIGEIFELLKRFQQGDHHDDYKHGDHHRNGHHGKYEYEHQDGHHHKYESHYNSQSGLCSKCGTAISSNHKFCPNCGSDCKTDFECKSCHAKAKHGDVFCSRCGCKL